jgi:hypothetical protein
MKHLIIITLLLIACSEDPTVYYIEPDLLEYVNTFYSEANKRGITLPKDNLILEWADDLPDRVNGRTIRHKGLGSSDQITIKIRPGQSDKCTEHVVYHELGHALLKRTHNPYYSYMSNILCGGYDEKMMEEMFNPLYR